MVRLIKIIGGLVVLGFVVVVAAAVVLSLVIEPNDFKPQIVEAVKQETGRDLQIEGELGLSVFPKVGLTLGKTELSNMAGFGEAPFARMKAVNIQVALMPLLDKRLEMDEIVVDGLTLNLKRNRAGRSNWDDLIDDRGRDHDDRDRDDERHDDRDHDDERHDGKGPGLESLKIDGIRIENANISWQDEQQGQDIRLSDFNLVSGALTAGRPVDITLNARLQSSQPSVTVDVDMKGSIRANTEGSQFTVEPLTLGVQATGQMLPGGQLGLDLKSTALGLDLKAQTMTLAGLAIDVMGLAVRGEVSGKSVMSAPAFSGRLSVAEFNARSLLKALGQELPAMADATTLTRVGASFALSVTMKQATLDELNAVLDDSKMQGRLALTDFSSQALGFDLMVDRVDLDRYLPPASNDVTTGKGEDNTNAGGLFPVEALRQLNMNGIARISEIMKMNMRATDVVVQVKAQGGHVNMKSSAALYQGKYNADATIDVRQKTPRLKASSRLEGVQIGPLLNDMQGKAELTGRTDANMDITASGNSQNAIKQTLNGDVAFAFTDGALVGVNIAKVIREGMSSLTGKSSSASDEPEKTDFSELGGTARITRGVIDNQDFSMKSPLLRISGAGKVNLVAEDLDYLVKVSIVGSLQGQGGNELQKLKGVTVPVRISGPFSNLSYRPDLSAVISDQVKEKAMEKVEEKKEAIKDKVRDKVQDKLKGKLKGLF